MSKTNGLVSTLELTPSYPELGLACLLRFSLKGGVVVAPQLHTQYYIYSYRNHI